MSYIKKAIFYESYHRNPVNKLIHIFFVPILLWTGLSIVNQFDEVFAKTVAACYSGYYIYLDKKVGISYSLILLLMMFNLNFFSFLTNVLIHVFSWIAQILSHKFIEKNSPALISGFWDALTIAPFFVWMEIWWFFGYNKNDYELIRNEGKNKNN